MYNQKGFKVTKINTETEFAIQTFGYPLKANNRKLDVYVMQLAPLLRDRKTIRTIQFIYNPKIYLTIIHANIHQQQLSHNSLNTIRISSLYGTYSYIK